VVPPPGWYFDVVPRSSIIKLGYLLANSVGVIDRSYRGEILVPLIKWDESAPDLELPQRVVQMVPRPVVHFRIEETQDLNAGLRGDRGFGSSGRL
jgi:dUTP pyrophosphatase